MGTDSAPALSFLPAPQQSPFQSSLSVGQMGVSGRPPEPRGPSSAETNHRLVTEPRSPPHGVLASGSGHRRARQMLQLPGGGQSGWRADLCALWAAPACLGTEASCDGHRSPRRPSQRVHGGRRWRWAAGTEGQGRSHTLRNGPRAEARPVRETLMVSVAVALLALLSLGAADFAGAEAPWEGTSLRTDTPF